MSLNTEWLWTPYDGAVDGSKFNRGDMSKSAYLEEIAFYTSIVKSNDIDLLALSEIENQYVAIDIARKLGDSWQAYFVQGRDTATGQDVALISRLPSVAGSLTNFGFPCGKSPQANKKKCLSKVIGAKFYTDPVDNLYFSVISAHFLSKRNDSKSKRLKRESQAYALSKAIQREAMSFSGRQPKLIVLGDFNDTYFSDTLKHLRESNQLKGALDCPVTAEGDKKRRLRVIDHILFAGFSCVKEFAVATKSYSDHDAIVTILK